MTHSLSRLALILRTYGFLGVEGLNEETLNRIRICAGANSTVTDLNIETHSEPRGQLYYPKSAGFNLFRTPQPVYHALLPHLSFRGNQIEPVWVNKAGSAVIAWHHGQNNNRTLLIGLDVEEEIIRHRQGDPAKVKTAKAKEKAAWDLEYERPVYLFKDQLLPKYHTIPWADKLGFFLAQTLSGMSGYPLIEPLPRGAKALIILTGDDDEAPLEAYDQQLKLIDDLPITYMLVARTHHTRETLRALPPNVEFGFHPVVVDNPEAYDQLCTEQFEQVSQLTPRALRTVRNHIFLNKGYLGHLGTWEKNGLKLDVNYPGADGTALNGSFLAMPARYPDGTWSKHYSLLTLFGDGMVFALELSERKAVSKIKQLARQIERGDPGILVFNFHPQNTDKTRRLHRVVLKLARRSHWVALGLESYLVWLEKLEQLEIKSLGNGRFQLTSPNDIHGLVLRCPTADGWRKQELPGWSGTIEVSRN